MLYNTLKNTTNVVQEVDKLMKNTTLLRISKNTLTLFLCFLMMSVSLFVCYGTNINNDPVSENSTRKVSAPANLRITASNAKKIALAWDKSQAQGYTVYMRQKGDKKWIFVNDISKNRITVKGLISGAIYTFKVRAYMFDGKNIYYTRKRSV